MITAYIKAAMELPEFELMENGHYFGDIPPCEGLWADGTTPEECRVNLAGALESWIVVGLQHSHKLPVIAGIDLNPQPEYAEAC